MRTIIEATSERGTAFGRYVTLRDARDAAQAMADLDGIPVAVSAWRDEWTDGPGMGFGLDAPTFRIIRPATPRTTWTATPRSAGAAR